MNPLFTLANILRRHPRLLNCISITLIVAALAALLTQCEPVHP